MNQPEIDRGIIRDQTEQKQDIRMCVVDIHIAFFLKLILNYLLLYIVIQKNDAHRVRTDQL